MKFQHTVNVEITLVIDDDVESNHDPTYDAIQDLLVALPEKINKSTTLYAAHITKGMVSTEGVFLDET